MKTKEKPKSAKLAKKYVLWLVTLIFAAGSVFFTVEMSSSGAMLAKLESQKEVLEETNRTLSDDLIRKSSLKSLQDSAAGLGFKKAENILYINEGDSVAAK